MNFLILAGGKGTRLWPLSRKYFSKQFLSLINNNTLIQETALRVSKKNGDDIYIISNSESKFIIKEQMNEIFSKFCDKNLIIEPMGKNTAPAIAFSSLFFNDNDILAVLSSDHYVKDIKKFNNILEKAELMAQKGYIVTLGIIPTAPKTGYGYIKKSKTKIINGFLVDKFVEKPDITKAKKYIDDGNYFWNAGIFIFNIKTFKDELKKNAPDIFSILEKIKQKIDNNKNITIKDYDKFNNISIDYALMEKTDKLTVIPSDFGWNDIGSFSSLYEILKRDNNNNAINMNSKNFININSKNLLVLGEKRKIAAINLNNLIIADTDDAILIANKDDTEKVKDIYNYLDKNKYTECEYHTKVYRPWGYFISLLKKDNYQVKQLHLRPLKKISYQYHNYRSETWTVVKGKAEITINDDIKILKPNESIFIPAKTRHRLKNISNNINLEIIEVQSGSYLGEDDIIRIEDDYDRK